MPTFNALMSIVGYLNVNHPPPLALSAAGPRARLAVERASVYGYLVGGVCLRSGLPRRAGLRNNSRNNNNNNNPNSYTSDEVDAVVDMHADEEWEQRKWDAGYLWGDGAVLGGSTDIRQAASRPLLAPDQERALLDTQSSLCRVMTIDITRCCSSRWRPSFAAAAAPRGGVSSSIVFMKNEEVVAEGVSIDSDLEDEEKEGEVPYRFSFATAAAAHVESVSWWLSGSCGGIVPSLATCVEVVDDPFFVTTMTETTTMTTSKQQDASFPSQGMAGSEDGSYTRGIVLDGNGDSDGTGMTMMMTEDGSIVVSPRIARRELLDVIESLMSSGVVMALDVSSLSSASSLATAVASSSMGSLGGNTHSFTKVLRRWLSRGQRSLTNLRIASRPRLNSADITSIKVHRLQLLRSLDVSDASHGLTDLTWMDDDDSGGGDGGPTHASATVADTATTTNTRKAAEMASGGRDAESGNTNDDNKNVTGGSDTATSHDALCAAPPAAGFHALEYLNISNCAALRDLTPIGRNAPRLTTFLASQLPFLRSIQWISQCPHIRELCLSRCSGLSDISPLANLPYLSVLDLSYCSSLPADGLAWLLPTALSAPHHAATTPVCRQLAFVDVTACLRLSDLSPLGYQYDLRVLRAGNTSVRDISWLGSSAANTCTKLKELSLDGCSEISASSLQRLFPSLMPSIAQRGGEESSSSSRQDHHHHCLASCDACPLAFLEILSLCNVPALTEEVGSILLCLPRLRRLYLRSCTGLSNASLRTAALTLASSPLPPSVGVYSQQQGEQQLKLPRHRRQQTLTTLDVAWLHQLTDIRWVAAFTELTELNIIECDHIESIEPIAALRKLRRLTASRLDHVRDVQCILGCVELRECFFIGFGGLQDIKPFALLPNLRVLHLTGTAVTDLSWLASASAVVNTLDVAGVSRRLLGRGEVTHDQRGRAGGETFQFFPQLEELSLARSQKLLDISPLGELPRLLSLTVSDSGVCVLGPRLRRQAGDGSRHHCHRCHNNNNNGGGACVTSANSNKECSELSASRAPCTHAWKDAMHNSIWGIFYSQSSRVYHAAAATARSDGDAAASSVPAAGPLSHMKAMLLGTHRAGSCQQTSLGYSQTLQKLDLSGCKDLADLSPLRRLRVTLHVLVCNYTNISDVAWISECAGLKVASFIGCKRLTNVGPAMDLENLVWLNGVRL